MPTASPPPRRSPLARNDIRQYEELAGEWWREGGAFEGLRWIAKARATLIPPARGPDAVLVDLGCGGGLLALYVGALGYRHVGVDLVGAGLREARRVGVLPVRADVRAIPLADACCDVVSAGEILEHVDDPSTVVFEAIRILRPGGTLVLDTINRTVLARLVAIRLVEALGGPAMRGFHDPALLVSRRQLVSDCARAGLELQVRGIRPRLGQVLRWIVTRRGAVTFVPTWSTAVLYQGWGTKQ
jgi:2-polyprenyl-6-hydroxyphenyl methylase/3-demethylubiquinone-9 3-methyltransferase